MIIDATTIIKRKFLPLNSINAKAYAAKAAIVIGMIVDGIVIASEL